MQAWKFGPLPIALPLLLLQPELSNRPDEPVLSLPLFALAMPANGTRATRPRTARRSASSSVPPSQEVSRRVVFPSLDGDSDVAASCLAYEGNQPHKQIQAVGHRDRTGGLFVQSPQMRRV